MGPVIASVSLGAERFSRLKRKDGTVAFSERLKKRDSCRSAGISVIPGACPMMFCEPVGLGHRCIRWILRLTGNLPR